MPHVSRYRDEEDRLSLKGNVGAEADALAVKHRVATRWWWQFRGLDQGRTTRDGAVVGHGYETPLPILPVSPVPTRRVSVRNAATDGELRTAIAETDFWSDAAAAPARGWPCLRPFAVSTPISGPLRRTDKRSNALFASARAIPSPTFSKWV